MGDWLDCFLLDIADAWDDFHLSIDWGNVATATVAIAAIIVSARFNVLTLRRSDQNLALAEQVAQRTEERYQADRIDARRTQLLDALIDAWHRVTVWTVSNAEYAALVAIVGARGGRAATAVSKAAADAAVRVQDHDMERHRPALAEAHRAVQLATLLFANTTGVLSPNSTALITGQLDEISRGLLRTQNLVQTVELDTPQQVHSAVRQFRQGRAEVANHARGLIELARVVIAGGDTTGAEGQATSGD